MLLQAMRISTEIISNYLLKIIHPIKAYKSHPVCAVVRLAG
jgi:hypothetical protein